MTDPTANTESIANREDCTVRKVNMTISLAFLAPDLVKAAIDGRLPHGMGVARRSPFSSRSRTMCFDVYRAAVPSKLPEQVFPDATPRPAHKTIMDRCWRTILRWAIAPATAAVRCR